MLKTILISLCLLCFTCKPIYADPWIAYGTTVMASGTFLDNPTTSLNDVIGERSLPFVVPTGYQLTITYMEVEGNSCDYSSNYSQFGMSLWLGTVYSSNDFGLLSCTSAGGSNQCNGFKIIIPAGKTVNIRCMNNTPTMWAFGFCVQGTLDPV